jgi:hypothetical protein
MCGGDEYLLIYEPPLPVSPISTSSTSMAACVTSTTSLCVATTIFQPLTVYATTTASPSTCIPSTVYSTVVPTVALTPNNVDLCPSNNLLVFASSNATNYLLQCKFRYTAGSNSFNTSVARIEACAGIYSSQAALQPVGSAIKCMACHVCFQCSGGTNELLGYEFHSWSR